MSFDADAAFPNTVADFGAVEVPDAGHDRGFKYLLVSRFTLKLEFNICPGGRLLGGFTLAASKILHVAPQGSDKPMQVLHRNLPTIFSCFCLDFL